MSFLHALIEFWWPCSRLEVLAASVFLWLVIVAVFARAFGVA